MRPLAIVLLPGIRARAYLQMMLRHGFVPDHVVLLGRDEDDVHRPQWGLPPEPDFDPTEDLRTTLARAGIAPVRVESKDVNGDELASTLAERDVEWCVFTGGGILRQRAFGVVGHWLHAHPGWLPDHRGSTCIHYGLLLEGKVGATAFAMTEGIDVGPIVCQRRFAPDPRWSAQSLDHSADAWMRAVVLLDALRAISSLEGPELEPQDPEQGHTFYVIHPVLKHLALLPLDRTRASAEKHGRAPAVSRA